MPIVITGADGFIGKNLQLRLAELGYADVVGITRATPPQAVQQALAAASFVFHLAGINRPQDPAEFATGNAGPSHGPPGAFDSCAGQLAEIGGGDGGQAGCGAAPVRVFASGYFQNPAFAGLDSSAFAG